MKGAYFLYGRFLRFFCVIQTAHCRAQNLPVWFHCGRMRCHVARVTGPEVSEKCVRD